MLQNVLCTLVSQSHTPKWQSYTTNRRVLIGDINDPSLVIIFFLDSGSWFQSRAIMSIDSRGKDGEQTSIPAMALSEKINTCLLVLFVSFYRGQRYPYSHDDLDWGVQSWNYNYATQTVGNRRQILAPFVGGGAQFSKHFQFSTSSYIASWLEILRFNFQSIKYSFTQDITYCICSVNRDLKQTRTATAVNKQLNFTVKNKPHTTNICCIFEAYFMIKSVWKNCTDCFEVILE